MLFLIAALQCEAQALIDHFHLLKKESLGNFGLYQNDSLALMVTGIGKTNVANAIGYLNGLYPSTCHAWLNVGIAGHAHHEIGEGFFIHKITDGTSNQHFYPMFVKKPPSKTMGLITVEKPEKTFADDSLYDMEGSAFFMACARFSSAEVIHSYKVVSDNAANSFEKLSKEKVSSLIASKVKDIEAMLYRLSDAVAVLESIHQFKDQNLNPFLQRWHFTATQSHILRGLLQKWQAVEPQKPIWDPTLEKLSKTTAVLQYLEDKINAIPLRW